MTNPRRSRIIRHMDSPRVTAYLRVSTAEQGESGAGLDAQRAAIEAEVDRRGWDDVRYVVEVASAKDVEGRPLFATVLDDLREGRADVLIASKQDRISRSTYDLSGMIATAKREGWVLITLDLGLDTSTPVGTMVAEIVASTSQLERSLIGQRTKDALAARRAAGKRHSAPSALSDELVARVAELRDAGMSFRKIAGLFNADGIPTSTGKTWAVSTVQAALASHAYRSELAERTEGSAAG